jgi:hypothetical protein
VHQIAKTEHTSEARIPPQREDLASGCEMLAHPMASEALAASGVLDGYVQARQTVLFGPEDIPVNRAEHGPGQIAFFQRSGRAAAHRAVLLAAIERHAANVPVWRWLARWYGALGLAQGQAIEDLNTFGWGQTAFSLTARLGASAPFVRDAWSVIDRLAAASVCYTKRSADFSRFTLTALRGTGEPVAPCTPLPARPGVMHSVPLTLSEMWNATKSFRSPDRAPDDVFECTERYHAYELEVEAPEPVWAHMPNGLRALKEIQPDVPGEVRTIGTQEPKRAPRNEEGAAQGSSDKRSSTVLMDDPPNGVINILDDPPRYGSPFLGEVEIREESRVVIKPVTVLPTL